MSTTQHFIEPLDVLIMRGNKLFGDPGSYGESLIPPWPSVAAGAIRSALLAERGYDLKAFGKSQITSDEELGTPKTPGSFTLTRFQLARRDRQGKIEAIYAMPADLVMGQSDDGSHVINLLRPVSSMSPLIESSNHTAALAVLPERQRSKPKSGLWLTADGWADYIQGITPAPNKHTMSTGDLWQLETRVGVGLDNSTGSAKDGQLFSLQAASLLKREHHNTQTHDIGFLTEVAGATLPNTLSLRFGGDGRGALAHSANNAMCPVADYDAIAKRGRCKLVLSTPGLFSHGWLPTGATVHDNRIQFSLHGVEAELISAAAPRSDIISGYDLAKSGPKDAQRVVSTGAVYWLEHLKATPEALAKLVTLGLWQHADENASRRAEGFNRLAIAAY